MFYRDIVDEDLVRLRRSLAMAPSLPASEIQQLLDEVERLRRTRREMADELEVVAAHIEQLRRRASPRSSAT